MTVAAHGVGDCRIAVVLPEDAPSTCASTAELQRLAESLAVPVLGPGVPAVLDTRCDVYLSADAIGPYLQLTGRRAPGPVRCGFEAPAMAYRRRGGQNELLGRATGVYRRPGSRVVDCTAGFAADGFVLADLGARVLLCEQHPLLAALLQLSLDRLGRLPADWRSEVAGRLSVRAGDVRSLPASALDRGDVLYLDPMFPAGRRSAAGKGMSLLQRLLADAPAESAAALLDWALALPVWRVVVKRPLKAPRLGGVTPSHTLAGRSVRFDVYQLGRGSADES